MRIREHVECGIVAVPTFADWGEYRLARNCAQLVYEEAERAFTEQSKSLLTNAPNPRK